jgi:hypothetical protein
MNATNDTDINIGWTIQTPPSGTQFGGVYQTPGSSGLGTDGTHLYNTFTFNPAGCTPGINYPAVLIGATNHATLTGPVSFSAPMLVAGSTPVVYNQRETPKNVQAGEITCSATSCVHNFTTAFSATPTCTLTPVASSVSAVQISGQSASGITVDYTGSGTNYFNVICAGPGGGVF